MISMNDGVEGCWLSEIVEVYMCFEIKHVQPCSCSANLIRSGWRFQAPGRATPETSCPNQGKTDIRQQCVKLAAGL